MRIGEGGSFFGRSLNYTEKMVLKGVAFRCDWYRYRRSKDSTLQKNNLPTTNRYKRLNIKRIENFHFQWKNRMIRDYNIDIARLYPLLVFPRVEEN